MRPEQQSVRLLGVARSKAKMIEYHVPERYQDIDLSTHPSKLFTISIGLLGDVAAGFSRQTDDSEALEELRTSLAFSARFFDSYLHSKLDEILDPYLMVLGSASYYLCNLPGSASVLASRIHGDCPDLNCDGLEDLLLWLLRHARSTNLDISGGAFGEVIGEVTTWTLRFFRDGAGEESLVAAANRLRAQVYEAGTPRQLLFGDVIAAIVTKKILNSSWQALPFYSRIPRGKWATAIQKESFVKELWPAQHLLGQAGVLRGESAIAQMPTSTGKTKAIEMILRSSFLAGRTSLAIIVAPFRALCHEIKNDLEAALRNESIMVDELTDTLQTDFELSELVGHQQIIVVTPEKLVFAIRHAPELASHVGLIVFDEGHQFDSGTRGITYELLLTSLCALLPKGAQKVLVSAVISNAEAVGEWLNGEPNVAEGANLHPTFRSLGFTSWLDQLGRIEYVDSQNAEIGEFFVPRVIERINLGKKGRELKDRIFPEKSDGRSIALYLGLKLVPNGSIAIFCGQKATVASLCEKAVDIVQRGIRLPLPSEFSDRLEVERLRNLHLKNLGPEAPASMSAAYGIFSHHGNTPHGIRLAVEHAVRENLVRFVICTSTLAQGVNLPIRYLIVAGTYQAKDRIKVRDFHNLMGRAGRAGMHTEGTILFADPAIYDGRRVRSKQWRWKQVKELLEPGNSEPCISTLLSVFETIKNDDGKRHIISTDALEFARTYIRGPDELPTMVSKIVGQHEEKGFSRGGVEYQVLLKIKLICAIESFLLAHWVDEDDGLGEADILSLAEGTLAFFLADDEKKEHIRELFKLLGENISKTIPEPARRRAYGKTLYGVRDAEAIEAWVSANIKRLLSTMDEEEALAVVWPLLIEHVRSGLFKKFDKPEVRREVANEWINGRSFGDLLDTIQERETKIIWGTKSKKFKVDDVVEFCENALAFEGSLLVGAICEMIQMFELEDSGDLLSRLLLLQKRLRYGLPTNTTIAIYESGFSDRVVAQDLAASLRIMATQRGDVGRELNQNRDAAYAVVERYPAFFQERMDAVLQ